ncbi:MerR family transcriptional regulator [Clostridium oryzae]|uniref:Mercuric resistance operon regulatory protein n=1 Tax=Clostridium oryzae TaxID=1450648 RepID=A0A1V4IER0_9CLOT|nr:MerR family transcriptional regulator [Clostridium oryzae]OPJ58135.1 mercuric resistance operon regulatory protein [Clostridium oryzae]
MGDKIYLSTGELAKMLGVTKQTVIYYDNIGLISPAKRGEKEYRQYTLEQADELDSILTFRNIGVSIKVLKEYLSERNAKRCIEMLKHQKEKVDKEIQKLDRIRKKIESRAKLLEKVVEVKDLKKVEFVYHEQEVYMIEECKEADEKSHMQSFTALCNHSKQLGIDFENPICNIIRKKDLATGAYEKTAHFGIKIPDDFQDANIERFIKPSGTYAFTYHQGSYETMNLTYERLIAHIKKHGYEVCGNAYETDLLSTLTSLDRNEYLKLIAIQVCKN